MHKYILLVLLSLVTAACCVNADNQLLTQNLPANGTIALYGCMGPATPLTDRNITDGGQTGSGTPQWIIDLGPNSTSYNISTTDFAGQYQGTGNAVTNWSVDYSTDDSNWTSAVANWNPGSSTSFINTTFSPVFGARYWRFTMNNNNLCVHGCWVDDFGLWGIVPTPQQLLTLNANYSGSTALYGNWAPTHLTDRNLIDGGQNNVGTPNWTIDLGPASGNDTINMTDFAGTYQGTGNAVTNWTVEYSTDDATWSTAVAGWNPGSSTGLINKTFTPVTGARYWRFTMNSNSCQNGCWVDDFGLWGTTSTPQLLTQNILYTGSAATIPDVNSWNACPANSLTDRNITDGGQSNVSIPHWIIDLGPAATGYSINTTDFAGQYQGHDNGVISWSVDYSTDDNNWTSAVANWNPGSSTSFINKTFTPVTGARYWRFTMNSYSCYNGCWVDDFGLWGTNVRLLTLNATYTGSTALYGNWAPTHLTDRNLIDGGQNNVGTPNWTIDFGTANYTIDMTDFAGSYQGQANAVMNWTVEYSYDNATWSTAVAGWNPGSSTGLINKTLTPVVGARYWRFTMNNNTCPNGCWVDDFGLWGT